MGADLGIVSELAVVAERAAVFHGVRFAVVLDADGIYRVAPLAGAVSPLYVTVGGKA